MSLCKCGCGRETRKVVSITGRTYWTKYYSSECYPVKPSTRKVGIKLCKCGCGRAFLANTDSREYYSRACSSKIYNANKKIRYSIDAPLCLCGCGQQVCYEHGKYNRYVNGHHPHIGCGRKSGYHHTEETKQKMRKPRGSRILTDKILKSRDNRKLARIEFMGDAPLCACGCGNPVSRKGSSKQWNKYISGHFHLEQKRIWEAKRGDALYCKCGCGNRVVWSKEKHGWNEYYGHHYSKDSEYRRKMSESMNTEEKRLELSQKSRDNYANPEYVEKVITGWNRKPSGFERLFEQLKPDMFIKYVGDFKLWIALPNGKQKNPDFIIEGTNKVIELHGDYWHKGEDSTELVRLYKDVGYDCLVIWENEMSDIKLVMKRVSDFLKKK